MKDYKLKVILTILSAVIFSLIFILLAFVVPVKKKDEVVYKKPESAKTKIQKISEGAQQR